MAFRLYATALGLLLAFAAADEEDPLVEDKGIVAVLVQYEVVFYIFFWYLSKVGYEIYNKELLIAYPFPWAVSLWQLVFGWFIFVPRWRFGIRPAPILTMQQALKVLPAAVCHLATHVGAVVSFYAGAVSFSHIVKSSEPVVSSLLNFLFRGEVFKWQVYMCLLPIIGGVGLASASELSFNWLCFGMAMVSNFGSATRAVYSKMVMGERSIGENMDPMNVYAVLTMMSTVLLLPITLAMESPSEIARGFKVAHAEVGQTFILHMLWSGFTYFMYNELAFLALSKLDPVSHAVSNTMLRVVIIVTSILFFHTAVTPFGMVGSCLALAGTLIYSYSKVVFR